MKRKLADLSVDEFFKKKVKDDEDGSSGIESDEDQTTDERNLSDNENGDDQIEDNGNENEETNDANSEDELDVKKHKASLKKLKQTEPEFYKFLEENDQDLLNFDEDSEIDSDDDESSKKHTLPKSLEVASDESEIDDDDDDEESTKNISKTKITKTLLNTWSKKIKEPKPTSTIAEIVSAFKNAVEFVNDEDATSTKQVKNSKALNGILRLCLSDLVPALNRILGLSGDAESFQPTHCKAWKKLQLQVKTYLILIVKVLGSISDDQIVTTMIKHLLQLVPYFGAFIKVAKAILKKLITIWSTSEETIRILSLMVIVRITRRNLADLLPFSINNMYVSYVKNCKFTSPITWPLINFMKHSLVEIFALDESVAYQHAFVYIRQMAIHLRNAITVKKKDAIKTVYNWQYVHCLYLWSQMLSTLHPSAILQPLIYPLVQIIIGTIKLVSTAKYIPLRFHCVRALTSISKETNTFIPVLPLLTEAFDFINFKKQHTKVSWKPMDFLCALKLSKSQITENGFKDAVIDQFYELVLDYSITQAHTVAFPELILPSIIQMKAFMKICSVPNYKKQIKQIMEKLEENSKHIEQKRGSAVLNLADSKAMEAWENASKQETNPLTQYYEVYRKLKDREVQLHISQKEQLQDNFPEIERSKTDDKKEFADLFAHDSSDDDNDSFFTKTKEIAKEIKTKKNRNLI